MQKEAGTMTVSALPSPRPPIRRRGISSLWDRDLVGYPSTPARLGYLSIVVLATIVLYYEAYAPGGVSPLILAHFHMSFLYYLNLLVVGSAFGAVATWLGGLSDKIGRANLVIWGQFIVALITLFGVPHAPSEIWYAVAVIAVGMIEGVVLVASPALVRDFSPQMGRASAMGFWTLGPVAGSLVVSIVANHTLGHLHPWQDQFVIAGITGLAMFAVSLVLLRELAPQIRDQRMVSVRDRVLIEAKARGLAVERMLSHPVRQMLRWNLISSALGVSLFLLIYYAAVGFFTIYFVTTYNMTTAQANGINTWGWAFNCGALVVAGVLSDRLRVRKPFMLVGALGSLAMTLVFVWEAKNAQITYYDLVVMVSVLFVFLGFAYAPWMAHYTEAIEAKNPALTATGLAVWGWTLRIVVALATLAVPHVVTSVTPLVQDAPAATQAALLEQGNTYLSRHETPPASYVTQLKAVGPPGEAFALLLTHQPVPTTLAPQLTGLIDFGKAVGLYSAHEPVPASLTGALAKSSPELSALYTQLTGLISAKSATPGQWQTWWWVDAGGQVVFVLVLLFGIRGRWRPSLARRDIEEYEKKVQAELAAVSHPEAA
jgi:MFS family permease